MRNKSTSVHYCYRSNTPDISWWWGQKSSGNYKDIIRV